MDQANMSPAEDAEKQKKLVSALCERTKKNKIHWDKEAFTDMRKDRRFVYHGADKGWVDQGLEIVNVAHRVVNDTTSALYARNPRTIYRRRDRMDFALWDETPSSMKMAGEMIAMGQADPEFALANADQIAEAELLLKDIIEGTKIRETYDKIGETLTLLYNYFRDEQMGQGRRKMKGTIRKSLVNGVSYVVPGFQRVTEPDPEATRQIADHKMRLDEIERRAAAIEEGEMQADDPEAIELREAIEQLANQPEVIVREGLTINMPDATTIIPDQNLKDLFGFEGCDEVAEEFLMTKKRVEATYGIKLSKFMPYDRKGASSSVKESSDDTDDDCHVCVWRVWQKSTGLCFTVCDGFDELLLQDTSPPVDVEGFWPWQAMIPKPSDDPEHPYPKSMVSMISGQCMEINRAAQGLADHRHAARPGTIGQQPLSTKDASSIKNRKAHDHITIETQVDDISKLMMPFPYPGIDPNLYETATNLKNIELATGSSEARLDPTPRVSATAASISEASYTAQTDSNRDELDEFGANFARTCGQILMLNMSASEVKRIVGEHAVWPEDSMKKVMEEIYLTVEFGSSGYPNQQQRVTTLRDLGQILLQIPGLNVEKFLKLMLEAVDVNIEITDFFDPTQELSIMGLNAMQGGAGQGGEDNAPRAPGPASTEPAITK